MYVLLDVVNLVFRHKHHSKVVLNGLAHIEVSHCHTGVYQIDVLCRFADLTDLDLRLLYKHTTGQTFPGSSRDHLEQMVLAAARAMPESDVVATEVMYQAQQIDLTDKGFYRYIKGSKDPEALNELFTPAPVTTTPEAANIAVAGVKADHAVPDPVPAHSSTGALSLPAPRGGNRALIFEVADKMWAAAGSPKDVTKVLALRRAVMSSLESEHGVKKSTSSTALGEWQKIRLNS